jgi:DNA polymerase III alpha subunit (gram-positive type)
MKKDKKELYFSIDIEADGPIAPNNSMLSFGCAAFDENGKLLETYSSNLELLPGAVQDPDTMKFWSNFPDAYKATRQNLQDPKKAMQDFANWILSFGCKPVFVGYPATFDAAFINWYFINFTGKNPFGFVAIDIKTYAMAVMKKPFFQCSKKNFPKEWLSPVKHNHIALSDAIEQGEIFFNIMKFNKENFTGIKEIAPPPIHEDPSSH